MLYDTLFSVCDVKALFSRQYFLFNNHILVQLITVVYYSLILNLEWDFSYDERNDVRQRIYERRFTLKAAKAIKCGVAWLI